MFSPRKRVDFRNPKAIKPTKIPKDMPVDAMRCNDSGNAQGIKSRDTIAQLPVSSPAACIILHAFFLNVSIIFISQNISGGRPARFSL